MGIPELGKHLNRIGLGNSRLCRGVITHGLG